MNYSNAAKPIATSLAAFLALTGAQSASARQSPSAAKTTINHSTSAVPAAEATAAKPPSERPENRGHEGITVHGHWVIEIRDPDGKLAEHREFENSLGALGGVTLSNLSLGSSLPLDYTLMFYQTPLESPCGPGVCVLVTSMNGVGGTECSHGPSFFGTNTYCIPGLTVSASALTQPPSAGVTYSGQTTAVYPGQISTVSTTILGCPNNSQQSLSVSNCQASFQGQILPTILTETKIAPINVLANQAITIIVTITFS